MSLRSRVRQLARRVESSPVGRAFRWVMVTPGDGPAITRDESGYATALRVPWSANQDPEAALTGEQRAAIRPGDRLIVICMPAGTDLGSQDNGQPHGIHPNGPDGRGDRTLARSGASAGA
jgi:hypothetical protein